MLFCSHSVFKHISYILLGIPVLYCFCFGTLKKFVAIILHYAKHIGEPLSFWFGNSFSANWLVDVEEILDNLDEFLINVMTIRYLVPILNMRFENSKEFETYLVSNSFLSKCLKSR